MIGKEMRHVNKIAPLFGTVTFTAAKVTEVVDIKTILVGDCHDAESQVFKRLLTLSVQLSQLEKLEKLDDPRDLDNLLTEIFEKSRSGVNKYQHCHIETKEASGFKYLIVDILRDLGQLVQTSEIRFLLIVTVAVLCGWFLHKRYRIGLLALFGGSLFIFGYIHTYLECNREMEVNQMIEFTKLANKQSQGNKGPNGVWGIIQRYFSSSESVQEEELLRKSTRLSLGFCRPDHVLIMYFNDIFMKYLEALIGQCTKTLLSLHENLGFPFNIIAGFLLIGLIGFIVKLVFHYTLNPAHWVHLIRPTAQFMPSPHHPLPQNNSNHVPSVDHISGENLKILLKTMNAMNAMPISKQPTNTVSGIEEVRESIEGPAERESAIVQDKETSSKVQDNNNAQKTDCKTNVLLEDLPADS
ncbi:uncharacterized protein LOC106083793 isoform X2 [Stomoxys calcitrans]|uniref:uncharacterized protein LOC106083793 isoform X2 n=1 Tax=Stomoxys calcitrans TaxID=35570 RepID=UPI0027E29DD5|nr:uncharacterized protein LOC106083793 isoform X2 [Stomoxys calcitrans]